jgi:hypothetical protein
MRLSIQNPWLSLPASAPFILPEDAEILGSLRHPPRGKYELRLDLPPQPWTGNVNKAEVFMLALNPGFAECDCAEFQNTDYATQWRLALSFGTRTPFYFLDPAFRATGGGRWWRPRLRDLIAVAGIDAVDQKVMCVEHFPYKSTKYKPLGLTLPSQRYSFEIVREAIRQRKQVVVMRSERVWLESVPELRTYAYVRLASCQNPHLSRAQMTGEQFSRLCAALQYSRPPS